MIEKKTWTQFDKAYSEFTQWPLELSYNVYSDIVDSLNKKLEECNEGNCCCCTSDDPHVDHG